ncbi:MAG: trifunctional dihydropteroate synthetase [Geoglossum umbratile]|nr:MAG: trifunctional dihydropteroate synthetase [Geoglossum umbratile]
MDIVFIRDIAIRAIVGHDCWHRAKAQSISATLRISTSIHRAGQTDNIADALDYRPIYKAATALDSQQFPELISFTRAICDSALEASAGQSVEATVRLQNALLHADGVELEASMTKAQDGTPIAVWEPKTLRVADLRIPCIIGVGAHERVQKQPLIANLTISGKLVGEGHADYQVLLGTIFERFEKSSYLTIEAFVTAVAKFVIFDLGFDEVTVSARKPSVFSMADGPGVEITRTRDSFQGD